jgi:hypothetical protein
MSFEGPYSESLMNACNAAYAAGVLLVAAAGNQYGGAVNYPAAYDSVIAVSAIDNSDSIAGFSSVGPEVELAAPGVNIKSTFSNGNYALASGTSMACPHVAGAAALVWAADELSLTTAAEVRNRLRVTAEDLGVSGKDNYFGYGLVDAATAAGFANVHNVAVTAIAAPASAIKGQTHMIEVTVENLGSFDETFDVILRDDTVITTIGTETVTLNAGNSTIISFSWDTTEATQGNHILTAKGGPVPEETDTTDNSKSTIVTVEVPVTDIAITEVDAPSSVVQGELINVSVTVENVGNQDVFSNINVALESSLDGDIAAKTISANLTVGSFTTVTFTWDTTDATADIDHTLTASHDFADSDASNDYKSTVVHVQAKPATPTMHAGDITFEADVRPLGRWGLLSRVTVIVPIFDSSAVAVSGAAVYGSWSGSYNRNVSDLTNSQGQVIFSTSWIRGGGTFTFTINDVTKAGWTYDPAANIETYDSITVP